YDPQELTEELIALFQGEVSAMPPQLRDDLVRSTVRAWLIDDVRWTTQALARMNGAADNTREATAIRAGVGHAHEDGYAYARRFRAQFDIPATPLADLSTLLQDRCGWASNWHIGAPSS